MKAKHPTGANLDDSLITSGGGTNADASHQQTSHIQPGLVDQSAEGDYPVFNAQSHLASEHKNIAQAAQAHPIGGQQQQQMEAVRMMQANMHHMQSNPQSTQEEGEATSAASDTYNLGSAGGEDIQHRGRGATKAFKFQTKFNRPFLEGEGPSDAGNSQNYNQKLTTFI